MAKLTTKLLVAAALVATAGCAKKRPPVLPPAPGPVDNGGGAGGQVTNPGDTGTSLAEQFKQQVVSDTIHFAFDQYNIDPQSQSILNSQAQWLMSHPQVRVTVEGHCDERGTREYNLALGDRRANAAANYLIARGISASRINTISYGKERPIALGSDEAAWAQNRRAVTVVLQ